MQLQSFADFSVIFQERFMKPLWERYPLCESDTWDALGLFLEGYAFERQGRRPDYGPAAVDSILKAKSNGGALGRQHVNQIWNDFKGYLGGNKLNEANNPLCPLGTSYVQKKACRTTNKQSILEFLLNMSAIGLPPNIIVYAKAGLAYDQSKTVHEKIREINGIGPKIASLFLRDVARFYSVFPSRDRHLLQPVDVWVRRIVKELGGPVKDPGNQDAKVDEAAQKWIVNESARLSVTPEAANQGMWYFATQVAGSYYRLKNSIHNTTYAEGLLTQHKQALERAAKAAASIVVRQTWPV